MENLKLEEWLDVNFSELSEMEISYESSESVKIPYVIRLLVSALLNRNGSDCVFVIPQAEMIAFLVSIFAALSNAKKTFAESRESFAKDGLKVGQRVKLIPNDTIYQYAGFIEGHNKKFFRLNLLGAKGGCISLELKDILRIFPTSSLQPIGGANVKGDISLCDLDKVIDIQSYGNFSLFKNRIILHSSKYKMEAFLEKWGVRKKSQNGELCGSIGDLKDFPWGTINKDGILQSYNKSQAYGEPIIAFSSNLSAIDEYCLSQEENSRTIISSNKTAIIENAYETDSLCRRHKVFLFTEELDNQEISELKGLGFTVWQLSSSEILMGIQTKMDLQEAEKFSPLKMLYSASKNERNSIPVHEAKSDTIEEIGSKLFELDKCIEDDEINSQTVQLLRWIYWRSLELMNIPDEKYYERLVKQSQSLSNILKSHLSFIGKMDVEKIHSLTKNIAEDLIPNINRHAQNKFDKTRSIIYASSGKRILLLFRNIEAQNAFKKRLGVNLSITYTTYDKISLLKDVYDIAIVISWPGKYFLGKLLSSGISEKIEAVLYPCEVLILNSYFKLRESVSKNAIIGNEQKAEIIGSHENSFKSNSMQDALHSIPNLISINQNGPAQNEPNHTLFDIEWFSRPNSFEGVKRLKYEITKAFFVSFNNDYCAYLTENHKLATIDSCTHQYKSKDLDELNIGDIIVFRQRGARGILKEIAEKMYPKTYETFLSQSLEWKVWLNDLGNEISKIEKKLSLHGLNRHHVTILNWIKDDDLIGPQDLNDIIKIAEATGDTKKISRSHLVANAVRELRGMHVEAGFKLTKIIMEQLTGTNVDERKRESFHSTLTDIELMTVEHIDSNPIEVPTIIVNEPHPTYWFNNINTSMLEKSMVR